MTAQQRNNKMADELFKLVEGPAGYAHISDGIGNLTEMQILSLAKCSRELHLECAKLLNVFIKKHAARIALTKSRK